MQFTNEQIEQNRADWKAALRSGKYKQGGGTLCLDDRYCCLGVACDVLKTKLALVEDERDGLRTYNGFDTYAPPEVTAALGLYSNEGSHRYALTFSSLAGLNDQYTSFQEIADRLDEPDSPYLKELA